MTLLEVGQVQPAENEGERHSRWQKQHGQGHKAEIEPGTFRELIVIMHN